MMPIKCSLSLSSLCSITKLGTNSLIKPHQHGYVCSRNSSSITTTPMTSPFQIWDEIQSKLVPLKPRIPNYLTWYACGPTVYDSAHIGHASSYIRLDVIRRILERQNIKVLQVMGITDMDDKIIMRSQVRNVPWNQITQKYETEFFQNLNDLNIKPPHLRARVTDFIPKIIIFISHLLGSSKKLAYTTSDGSVYFDTSAYCKYGIFRGLTSEETIGEKNKMTEKRNPQDFALWKGFKPGEPFWEAPWGKGRPGWHIECSVFASHFFGNRLDIHSGGMDLTFPHHENEEAQCCARFDLDKWVTHWIHTGHLHLSDDVKMSKSLGNTITINEFLKENSPDTLRMLSILKKYSSNIDYSSETKAHAISLLKKLNSFLKDSLASLTGIKEISFQPGSEAELWDLLQTTRNNIETSYLSNFDSTEALHHISNLVSNFNQRCQVRGKVETNTGIDYELILAYRVTVEDFMDLMGFTIESRVGTSLSNNSNIEILNPILDELVGFRRRVRKYALALDEMDKNVRKEKSKERSELVSACDGVRENLGNYGIEIKDHGLNSSWSYNSHSLSHSSQLDKSKMKG